MLAKWKSAVYKERFFGVPLTELSNVFDCISHDIWPVKLHASWLCLSKLKSN